MAQPPITGDQVDEGTFENILETGTSFPVSPDIGKQFFLTADLVNGGSPATISHPAGTYTYNGAQWISKPATSASNYGWNDT